MTALNSYNVYLAMSAQLKTASGAPTGVNFVEENRRLTTPTIGTPYWVLTLMTAQPFKAAMGRTAAVWRLGYLNVLMHYPANAGPGPAALGAASIASVFQAGTVLTNGTVTVKITDPVDVRPAQPGADWYVLPVRIPFKAFDTSP